jgi:MFS family permease
MSMFLIFQTFPDRLRGTAMGLFSIGVVLAPAFGPALGGVAVDLASWRLVFVATLPLAILALMMAPFLMPSGDRKRGEAKPPLDWQGLCLLAVGGRGTALGVCQRQPRRMGFRQDHPADIPVTARRRGFYPLGAAPSFPGAQSCDFPLPPVLVGGRDHRGDGGRRSMGRPT